MIGWMLGIGLAMAEEEQELIPELWLQCSPTSGLLSFWDNLPPSFRENAGGFAEATPASFSEAGGVLDGKLVAYGSEDIHLEVSFSGRDEQIPHMLELINPNGIVWQRSDGIWQMELPDDLWVVRNEDGFLKMASMTASDRVFELPQVAEYLPAEDGCIAVLRDGPIVERLGVPLNGGLFLPFDDSLVQVVMEPKQRLPEMMATAQGSPLPIKTVKQPVVVMTLGFSPVELLSEPLIQERLPKLNPKEVEKIQRRLRIPAGTVLALENIPQGDAPKIMVGLPIHNRFGRDQASWLIWRGIRRTLKKSGADFIELDKRVLSLQYNAQTVYIGVQKGRILMALNRAALNDVMSEAGTLWFSSEMISFASDWPVAVQVSIPQMMAMMIGGLSTVRVGLRAENEYIVTALDARTNSGLNAVSSLLQLAGNVPEMQASSNTDVSLHTVNMMKIAAREHQIFEAEGAYQPVGLTVPSMLADADGFSEQTKVDWSEEYTVSDAPTAVELGWLPDKDIEGAMYWVEVTESGFSVHALVAQGGSSLLDERWIHVVKDHTGKMTTL